MSSKAESKTTARGMLVNRLFVDPPPTPTSPSSDPHVIGISSEKAAELGLHDGDFVNVRGSQGNRVIASVFVNDACTGSRCFLGTEARKNLKKRTSDSVVVSKVTILEDAIGVRRESGANNLPAARLILATTAAQIDKVTIEAADIVDRLVRPYFSSRTGADGTFPAGVPVTEGQLIHIPIRTEEAGATMTFKVMKVENPWTGRKVSKKSIPADSKFGMVVATTELEIMDKMLKDKDLRKNERRVGYSDIGGLKSQLKKIREMVELPLRHPRLFTSIGVKPPKGVLMYGPPGTGKTMIARAISNEVDCNFMLVNGPEIIGGPKGQSEENIRKLFAEAAENAPTLIFIDEIDAIAPNRDQVADEQMQRVVATLLTEMDGIKRSANIMVIAATNRPNAIDPALRRAGRFDAELQIPVPTREGRLEILQIMTKDKMALAKPGEPGAVDLEEVARKTHGFVGADLNIMCTKAAVMCIRQEVKQGNVDIEAERLPTEFYESLRVTQAHIDQAIKGTPPSAMKEFFVEIPDVSFADIGGLEQVKNELREMVEFPVSFPEYFDEMGQTPPKGALLYGPPGCGKTLLAKAMAHEAGVNFISIKGPQLLSKWVGESEENVRNVFAKARQAAPCILFFDELDSIARERGARMGGPGIGDSVVNQLLTEMDGMGKRNNVFVLGATNRSVGLDKALMRPGRLDHHIYVPLPDIEAREKILVAVLRKAKVSPQVDLAALARATSGMSGADLSFLAQQAAKLSMRRRKRADAQGQDTSDWVLEPVDFEHSYGAARRSVSDDRAKQYEEQRSVTGQGGVTSGVNLAAATGRYMLSEEATRAKIEAEQKQAAEEANKAEEMAQHLSMLKARGKAGLRSASGTSAGTEQKTGGVDAADVNPRFSRK